MASTSQISLGPDVTVDALLDAVADHPRRLEDAFPATPDGGWEAARAAHPASVGREGRWRLTVYAYLIRAHGTTVLVDAGVGPVTTVAAEWLGVTGSLPSRLAAVGSEPATVDLVVFTHLHEDHVGWGADPAPVAPAFANARYVVSHGEWAAEEARGVRRHVEEGLGPARRAGRLETPPPGELARGVALVALPGHTPGHCGVLVTGSERTVLLAGDTFNHPVQVRSPQVPSGADADPGQATRTRHEVLELLESGTVLGASAHLPGGWWRVRHTDGAGSGPRSSDRSTRR